MTYLQIIDENIPCLNFGDDGDKGLIIMQDHSIRHLPVVKEDNHYVGIISEDIIMDGNYRFGDAVGNFVMSAKDFFCHHDAHWMEVIKFMEDHQISIAPLIDEKGIYKGMATYESIVRFLTKANFVKENGSILIIETNRFSFSLIELSKIIESNDAKLMYLDTDFVGEENMWITLKMQTMNLSSIIENLERYNYIIINSYDESIAGDNLKERYDALMKYLNT